MVRNDLNYIDFSWVQSNFWTFISGVMRITGKESIDIVMTAHECLLNVL